MLLLLFFSYQGPESMTVLRELSMMPMASKKIQGLIYAIVLLKAAQVVGWTAQAVVQENVVLNAEFIGATSTITSR